MHVYPKIDDAVLCFSILEITRPQMCTKIYSISFFALKNRLRYSTCHVARPKRQHIPNMLKKSTLLFVDSKTIKVIVLKKIKE